MTYFRVAGEQPVNRSGDSQRVTMPLNPAFKSGLAQPSRTHAVGNKATEEANFAPF